MSTVATVRDWKIHSRKAIIAASGMKGLKVLRWIRKAENPEATMDELRYRENGMEKLDNLIAEGINKGLKDQQKREFNIVEENLVKQGSLLAGRQAYHMLLKSLATDMT